MHVLRKVILEDSLSNKGGKRKNVLRILFMCITKLLFVRKTLNHNNIWTSISSTNSIAKLHFHDYKILKISCK